MKRWVWTLVLVSMVLSVGVVLIVEYVAPAWIRDAYRYERFEAQPRIIASGAIGFYKSVRRGPGGKTLPADLPPSVGPTGSICGNDLPASDPGWERLGYARRHALRAHMRAIYIRESATTFVARINGDVDCDGIESTFERRCVRREDGFDCAPFEAHIEE